ncbi:tetratricopeptide repeat protein, partial [uncultured Pseudoalteromonas sp.]|uniref:tetratricopeptide repeat protein n=1 Tax=uncultured Pseudoalteromonas sp. TaxID=114053 RepID=UPI00260FC3C0
LLKKERFGWQAYNSLGWTYYQKQLYDKAMQMFRISIKIQPNKSEARKGMGYVYCWLEKYDSAITMLEQCLALNPDPNPVFERVTGSNAIAPFQMQTTARTKLGRIHFIKDDILMAINLFNEEIRRNPSQPDAFDGLGWAYLKQGRSLEARSAFNTAIQLEPLNNSAQNEAAVQSFLEKVKPYSVIGLLATVVLLFGFQANTILAQPLNIVLIAIPLVLQTYGIFAITYFIALKLRLKHNIAGPACLIGTSNFFELAVAVAISLFGLHSGAALATVVGVLVEVPVMLSLVAIVNKTTHWFKE